MKRFIVFCSININSPNNKVYLPKLDFHNNNNRSDKTEQKLMNLATVQSAQSQPPTSSNNYRNIYSPVYVKETSKNTKKRSDSIQESITKNCSAHKLSGHQEPPTFSFQQCRRCGSRKQFNTSCERCSPCQPSIPQQSSKRLIQQYGRYNLSKQLTLLQNNETHQTLISSNQQQSQYASNQKFNPLQKPIFSTTANVSFSLPSSKSPNNSKTFHSTPLRHSKFYNSKSKSETSCSEITIHKLIMDIKQEIKKKPNNT